MVSKAITAVPYAFAKLNGVVVTALTSELAEVTVREDAQPRALAELRRTLGVPLRSRAIAAAEFDELLASLYIRAF